MFQPSVPSTNFSLKVARGVVMPSLPPMTVIVDTLGIVGLGPWIASCALMMFPRKVRKFLASIFKSKTRHFFNMRCDHCDHTSLCTSCIQLESHECSGILNKIQSERDTIEKRNPKIEGDKITKI